MSRKIKILLGLVVLIVALKWWSLPPSEEQLKARFIEHRADFEQLRTMIQTDAPLGSLHTFQNSVQRDDGSTLSPARVRQYQTLMKALHVWSVDGDKDRFHMYVFGGGFTDTSWSIGYAFERRKPDIIVPSVYGWRPRQNKTAFAPLAGNWYLYHLR